MTSSYLSTRLVLPLPPAAIEPALDEPVGRCSPALQVLFDDACRSLREPAADALQHHADVAWLDAHIDWLAALTGWQLLLLLEAASSPHGGRREQLGAWGWQRRGERIACLAFAAADAALAERLAARLPAGGHALFTLVPSGDSDRLDVLLGNGPPRRLAHGDPGTWHPIRRWLDALPGDADAPTAWPGLDARRRDERDRGAPLLAAWQAFMAAQRRSALARASSAAPLRLGPHHASDGRHVDYLPGFGSAPLRLDGADPASFRVVEDDDGAARYGIDAHRLWHRGDRLPCADPAAFAPLAVEPRFMTDGHHVYFGAALLDGIDARRARAVPGSDWPHGFLHDDLFVAAYGSVCLHEVDGATFRALGRGYHADRHGVYELHEGELVVQAGFDGTTIRIVEHDGRTYLADATHVALARGNGLPPRPLKGAKADTFRGMPDRPVVTDGRRVWLGAQLQKGLDADAPPEPPPAEPRDAGGDGAGTLVVPLSHVELDVAGSEVRFLGAAVRGWHPATHRVGSLGCIEDGDRLYTLSRNEGGSILAWTKAYADYPLRHYVLDAAGTGWHPAGPLPGDEALRRMPSGTLLTPAEFETLFACLPAGEAFGGVESTIDEPAVTVVRWRDARILQMRGALRYEVKAVDGRLDETISPARTPGLCAAIRGVLETLLASAPATAAELRRQAASTDDAAAASVARWCRHSLPGLVERLLPRSSKGDAQALVNAVRSATTAAADDPAGAAWEALLDGLDARRLLVAFDKQDLRGAVALCRSLAAAAGLAADYELGEPSPGRSVFDIAGDFERWLAPCGHALLWPQGSRRSCGDDQFPAIVVRSAAVDDVAEAARALGGGRGFVATAAV